MDVFLACHWLWLRHAGSYEIEVCVFHKDQEKKEKKLSCEWNFSSGQTFHFHFLFIWPADENQPRLRTRLKVNTNSFKGNGKILQRANDGGSSCQEKT